jgi:phosphoglycolate phosphatase
LLLFDIDGTLVRKAGPHHRHALEDAARAVTGRTVTTAHIPTQGMMDGQIIRLMLEHSGATAAQIRRAMPAMIEKAQQLYVERCPDLKSKVCPGARALLCKLARRRVRTGLVTGNLSRIAWKKMERAGLKNYLQFGAFAESAEERRQLVALAIRRARREGWVERGSLIALVGDHENDILAAQANGIPVVSVATGVSPATDLARLKPDFLIDDLRSFPWQEFSL